MEAIIISVAQYKDKDAVVSAISKEKSFTFYARGIRSNTSKYSFLNCIFTRANINLIDGKIKHPILESAEFIDSPNLAGSSLDYLQCLLSIQDTLLHSVEEEEKFLLYDIIDTCLDDLKNGVSPLHVTIYFFLKILPILGFGIEVNSCVLCNSKKGIVDFSFVDGGFLCNKCANIDERHYTNNQLMLIRNTILSKKPVEISMFDPEDSRYVLKDIAEFLYDGLGYRNKTLDNLLK